MFNNNFTDNDYDYALSCALYNVVDCAFKNVQK